LSPCWDLRLHRGDSWQPAPCGAMCASSKGNHVEFAVAFSSHLCVSVTQVTTADTRIAASCSVSRWDAHSRIGCSARLHTLPSCHCALVLLPAAAYGCTSQGFVCYAATVASLVQHAVSGAAPAAPDIMWQLHEQGQPASCCYPSTQAGVPQTCGCTAYTHRPLPRWHCQ
jgi:hypothetical protein